MTEPFVIIGCGECKRPGKHAAVDLYDGSLYRSRLRYAKQLGGPHAIFSGLHGLIAPDRVIAAYEFRVSERANMLDHWLETQALQAKSMANGKRIVLLASGHYARMADMLPAGTIEVPGRGLPIGKLLGLLKRLSEGQHG